MKVREPSDVLLRATGATIKDLSEFLESKTKGADISPALAEALFGMGLEGQAIRFLDLFHFKFKDKADEGMYRLGSTYKIQLAEGLHIIAVEGK